MSERRLFTPLRVLFICWHKSSCWTSKTWVARIRNPFLPSTSRLIIGYSGKNLGPALMEREKYIDYALNDHSSDIATYYRLMECQAR
eukprot:scaffold191_cov273-Chaetoceros_neogracile.AAC.18